MNERPTKPFFVTLIRANGRSYYRRFETEKQARNFATKFHVATLWRIWNINNSMTNRLVAQSSAYRGAK